MKTNVSATIDKKLLKRLDTIAKQTERNRSWLLNKAVECYLEEYEDLNVAKARLSDERLTPAQLRKALHVSG